MTEPQKNKKVEKRQFMKPNSETHFIDKMTIDFLATVGKHLPQEIDSKRIAWLQNNARLKAFLSALTDEERFDDILSLIHGLRTLNPIRHVARVYYSYDREFTSSNPDFLKVFLDRESQTRPGTSEIDFANDIEILSFRDDPDSHPFYGLSAREIVEHELFPRCLSYSQGKAFNSLENPSESFRELFGKYDEILLWRSIFLYENNTDLASSQIPVLRRYSDDAPQKECMCIFREKYKVFWRQPLVLLKKV